VAAFDLYIVRFLDYTTMTRSSPREVDNLRSRAPGLGWRRGREAGVGERRSYPTEPERAIRASLLGALLGLVLAMLARARRAH
jgi:hypothetical protein